MAGRSPAPRRRTARPNRSLRRRRRPTPPTTPRRHRRRRSRPARPAPRRRRPTRLRPAQPPTTTGAVSRTERLRARFEAAHPFPLDDFQRRRPRRARRGPVGARRRARPAPARPSSPSTRSQPRSTRARKTFYTTPLKALSNQKYGDFVRLHGAANVGLLTGDNVINGDAPIVVMTTEVLRNMIYAQSSALDRLPLRGARRGALPPGPGRAARCGRR